MDLLQLLHNTICGGVAAAGFGVLFNTRLRALPWCFASGALGLAVRTTALAWGLSFESASFLAALSVGIGVKLLPVTEGVSQDALRVVGCIPMIPGAFAARAILGLFAVSGRNPEEAHAMLASAALYGLRVVFTIFALGTGLAIPALIAESRRQLRESATVTPSR